MRKIALIYLLLFLTLNIIAQETIIKTEHYSSSEQIKSYSNVLKSDTTIRHGQVTFFKRVAETEFKYFKGKNHDRLIVAKGQYDHNEKVGLWEFFLEPKFYYDFDRDKLITYQLRYNYPFLAQELGIQGDVVIQYNIDTTGQLKNMKAISGDSILIKGTIENIRRFNRGQAKSLRTIADILEDWERENIVDTLRYRLE